MRSRRRRRDRSTPVWVEGSCAVDSRGGELDIGDVRTRMSGPSIGIACVIGHLVVEALNEDQPGERWRDMAKLIAYFIRRNDGDGRIWTALRDALDAVDALDALDAADEPDDQEG